MTRSPARAAGSLRTRPRVVSRRLPSWTGRLRSAVRKRATRPPSVDGAPGEDRLGSRAFPADETGIPPVARFMEEDNVRGSR